MTPVEKLLDENNDENIILYNENDEEVEFEQIAVIYLDDTPFALLHPVTEMDGVADDEAIVFEVIEMGGESYLEVCDDDETVDAVFEEYYRLLRASGVDV